MSQITAPALGVSHGITENFGQENRTQVPLQSLSLLLDSLGKSLLRALGSQLSMRTITTSTSKGTVTQQLRGRWTNVLRHAESISVVILNSGTAVMDLDIAAARSDRSQARHLLS